MRKSQAPSAQAAIADQSATQSARQPIVLPTSPNSIAVEGSSQRKRKLLACPLATGGPARTNQPPILHLAPQVARVDKQDQKLQECFYTVLYTKQAAKVHDLIKRKQSVVAESEYFIS